MPSYDEAHSRHGHKKSFSRLLSKEVSQPNSSCRIYYGEAAGAIPFVWESQPGTPKHALFDYSSSMPPLTPPPSFSSAAGGSKMTAMRRSASNKPRIDLLMSSIFHRSNRARRRGSFSLSSLSSSSSSSSSWPYDQDHEHDSGDCADATSPNSTLCFQAAAVKKSAWRLVFGCYAATVKVTNGRVKNIN